MEISSLDFQYIGQLIYETHQLSVSYIDPQGEIIFEYTSKALQKNLNYTSLMEQLTTYPYDTASKDYPIFISIEDFHFFFINLNKDNHYLGALLVGPSLTPANHHIVKQNFDCDNQSVPTHHYQQFIAISLFVYYLIYQKN
ncbi:hypothetical protein [Lysinibacillus macroides]|uniref:hypothetical protein n=1 Tax=Lysinibacillus macroides TaxID=33935 RepID=UPI000AC6B6FA|nr:hypothetical protein [Lysinibacillus macroides]